MHPEATGPGGSIWLISALALTPDGRMLILAGEGEPQFWEIPNWRKVRVLNPATIAIKPIAVMPDGARVVFGTRHQVKMYQLKTKKEILAFPEYPTLSDPIGGDGRRKATGFAFERWNAEG